MPTPGRVAVEMVVVGLCVAILGLLISIPWMRIQGGEWPSWQVWLSAALSLFFTGALLHFIYQVTGLNQWYVNNYV